MQRLVSSFLRRKSKHQQHGRRKDEAEDDADDDCDVFYDCISHDDHCISPIAARLSTPVHVVNKATTVLPLSSKPTTPSAAEVRKFPLSLAKNHHYVTVEEFELFKRTDPGRLINTYSEPPAHQFQVRGPDYLTQTGKNAKHLKVPSQESAYEVVGVSMYRFPTRPTNSCMAENIQPLKRFLDAHHAGGALGEDTLPKFLIINWIVAPLFGKECHVCSHVFQLKERLVKDGQLAHLRSAFAKFRAAGTDLERSNQFKFMGKIAEGPRAITATISALGAERPVLLGKQLTTTYSFGANFIEVTSDVSSSRIAAANCGTILRNLNVVVMDMAWLLEGQRTQDLPENVLCTIRWIWNTMEDLVINLDERGELLLDEDEAEAA